MEAPCDHSLCIRAAWSRMHSPSWDTVSVSFRWFTTAKIETFWGEFPWPLVGIKHINLGQLQQQCQTFKEVTQWLLHLLDTGHHTFKVQASLLLVPVGIHILRTLERLFATTESLKAYFFHINTPRVQYDNQNTLKWHSLQSHQTILSDAFQMWESLETSPHQRDETPGIVFQQRTLKDLGMVAPSGIGTPNLHVSHGDELIEVQMILLIKEILHQLICSLSHHLQGFTHPRW